MASNSSVTLESLEAELLSLKDQQKVLENTLASISGAIKLCEFLINKSKDQPVNEGGSIQETV